MLSMVGLDRSRELRAIELQCVLSNDVRVERDVLRARDAGGKRFGSRFGDEHARHVVDDRVERASTAKRDDRPSAGLRFDRHDAEVLLAGQQDRRRSSIEVANRFIGKAAEQLNVGAGGELRQRVALRSVSDDAERHARKAAGLDGDVDAFVGNQGRHNQQEVFGNDGLIAGRAIEIRIDRRIDDNSVTIIVPPDPAGNVLRDGHIAVHPPCGGRVPAGERAEDRAQQPVRRLSQRALRQNTRRTGPTRSASA